MARLTPVTQPTRPSTPHAQHDRLLVVRHAAGEPLDQRELADVRQLLAGCPECVALVDELALISRATAAATFPARTRDFRLTPADAARLRSGSRLRRFREWLGAPSSTGAVLRPLAGAVLGLGLVLVVVGNVLPDMRTAPAADRDALVLKSSEPVAAGAPTEAAAPPQVQQRTGNNPEVMAAPASPLADQSADNVQMFQLESPVPSGAETAMDVPTEEPGADESNQGELSPTNARRDGTSDAIVVLGILLSVAAAAVLLLSWIAGRIPGQARG